MEKIQVNVIRRPGDKISLISNTGYTVAINRPNNVAQLTSSDCDYIMENNLSTVEIEAEWKSNCHNADIEMGTCSECGQHKYSEDCHLVPLITDDFVKVVREPKELTQAREWAALNVSVLTDSDVYAFKAGAKWKEQQLTKPKDEACNVTEENKHNFTIDYVADIRNKLTPFTNLVAMVIGDLHINDCKAQAEQANINIEPILELLEKLRNPIEAGKAMSATEWIQKEYKGLVLFASPHVVEAYAEYRVKAENLFTKQDMCNLIQSLKNYTREGNVILGFDEREPEEFLEIFLTKYENKTA